MFNALYNALLEWNRGTDDRQKLQHTYLLLTLLSLIVAGLVSLVDSQTGKDMLLITVAAGAIFLINAVIWSLLEASFLARLSGRRKRQN